MPSVVPGDFKVHVAVVVFGSGDVGKDRVAIALHDKSHRDAGDTAS